MTDKTKKRLCIIGICVVAVVLVIIAIFMGNYQSGKKGLSKDITSNEVLRDTEIDEDTEVSAEAATQTETENQIEAEPVEAYEILNYQGQEYVYKDNLVNILCLGIDKEEEMAERDDDGNSVGQADAIFLVSLDLEENKIRIVAVPRDTMVKLQVYDGNLQYRGTRKGQVTLQYAYADGQEKSAVLMAAQVSALLNEIPINAYAAINMSCLEAINDAVGGVDITMDADYTVLNPALEKGATVHLTGDVLKAYVFNRDTEEAGSAYTRIQRIKQYIMSFFEKAKVTLKEDMTLPVTLMEKLQKDMTTDITADELVYIMTEIIDGNISIDKIETLPGEIVKGEKYEEYYLNEEAVTELLVNLFYEVK